MAGCPSNAPEDETAPTTNPDVESGVGDTAGRTEVQSLELTFRLPDSFAVADDPDLEFLARSPRPPAILSIARDTPEVVDHEPAPGETISEVRVGDVDAVIVENAVLEDLPPGVVANQLLVANGSRSFSLILSAIEQDLAPMWDELLSSLTVS